VVLAVALTLGACSSSTPKTTSTSSAASDATTARGAPTATGVWDESAVHEIAVSLDDKDLTAMIDTYQESGEKEWIEAGVTLDGTTFERVGLRLKGNSSLRGVDDGTDPAELPWLIRLDKFVDGQELEGSTDFVVRSSSSETALNEAVALDLLAEAGLASEHAVATSFRVNGGEARLRLVVQALDNAWETENFDSDGLLYKSEAGGDWSWRGNDPEAYTDVFDQETGDDDLDPLIEFLDFVNNSSDKEFREELADKLDVQAFARYLAFEDLVANFDDIDGPGNNSYLRYDAETGSFTVVAWDHNLAFGVGPGGRGFGGGPGDGAGRGPAGFGGDPDDLPSDFPRGGPPSGMPEPPDGGWPDRPDGGADGTDGDRARGGFGGFGGRDNVLVERFTAVEEWADLVDEAKADLTESLYDSGLADDVLDRWADLLGEQAGDLVDADTVAAEADAIRDVIAGDVTSEEAAP